MTNFLLTISLLLNGISIYFIFILYSRQNRLLEAEKSQDSFKKEMENEISAFLFEMKEENEEFIKRFQQLKQTPHQSGNPAGIIVNSEQKNDVPDSPVSAHIDELNTKDWERAAAQSFKKQAVKVYQKTIADQEESFSTGPETAKPPENQMEDSNIDNEEIYRNLVINQIKNMQNQGLTIDDIAKMLNKGKTEIELLLKFG
jgi:DNA-directed RNA polymerase beta' subunit